MESGNNKGRNKGKKYIRKKNIDSLYAEKAESFNTWFLSSHESVKLYLNVIKCYDEDAFNDCYLKIYNTILYSGIDISNYKSYFVQSYLTILSDGRVKENRYCELLSVHEKEDVNTGYSHEIEEKQNALEKDILNYIYLNYSLRDFELFKMYMNLKPAVNYSSLSEITGVRVHTIQRTISRIKKSILNNKDFLKRWNEL